MDHNWCKRIGICLGNKQGNFQLNRFTTSKNIAKVSGVGLLFLLTLSLCFSFFGRGSAHLELTITIRH